MTSQPSSIVVHFPASMSQAEVKGKRELRVSNYSSSAVAVRMQLMNDAWR